MPGLICCFCCITSSVLIYSCALESYYYATRSSPWRSHPIGCPLCFQWHQIFFASMDTVKQLGRSARPMRGLRGLPLIRFCPPPPPGPLEAAPPSCCQHAMARWGVRGAVGGQNNNRDLCSGQDMAALAGCDPRTSQSPPMDNLCSWNVAFLFPA